MAIRQDYWRWAVKTFGKKELTNLINNHPRKDIDLFIDEEEKAFVNKLLN